MVDFILRLLERIRHWWGQLPPNTREKIIAAIIAMLEPIIRQYWRKTQKK